MSFLDYRHPEYPDRKERSKFAHLYRTGKVARRAEKQATRSDNDHRTRHQLHLVRRSQGETLSAYRERVHTSRFPRHMARVVTSFVGSLMQNEGKATRNWSDALGAPSDDDSVMQHYADNIDGQGTSLPAHRMEVADTLTTSHRQWYLVDPPADEGDMATIHLLSEADVVNWVEEQGRLTDVLVRESHDARTSVEQETGSVETYIRFTTEGWARYRKDEEGDTRRIESQEWRFGFYQTPDRQVRRVPIGYVDLGLKEDVGYNLARGNRYLFNLLSDIRWGIRRTSFSKLAPQDDTLNENEYELAARALDEGSNFLTFPAQYIAPDSSVFADAYKVWKDEVRDYYVTAFQSYQDAAKEKTATEIQQNEGAGRFSYLSVLARNLDEWENDVLDLLHQVEVPRQPGQWAEARVKRSRDFQPIDAEVRAQKLMRTFFRGPVPAGEEGRTDAARQVTELLGVESDTSEIESEVSESMDRDAQAQSAENSFLG